MCRHLAYLGPPLPLAALLYEPPHALVRQSWAPRQMWGNGTVNADGFGVGWYTDATEPLRYRRDCPIWADANLPALAAATSATAVLAALRSATPGMPVVETAVAPFAEGPWLFSHNGMVPGWPDSMVPLAAGLPTRDLLTLDAPTDAALLWALVRHRLRAGADPAAALAGTVRAVRAVAPDARLNLLLTDGRTAAGTAVGAALWMRAGGTSALVCSEPLDDDPGWSPVPEGHLVVIGAGHRHTEPIDAPTTVGEENRQ